MLLIIVQNSHSTIVVSTSELQFKFQIQVEYIKKRNNDVNFVVSFHLKR